METLITEKLVSGTTTYISAICGKTSAMVTFDTHGVRVCCNNASHRVWRGFGRFFSSCEDALNSYKSAEMRSILCAAQSEIAA